MSGGILSLDIAKDLGEACPNKGLGVRIMSTSF